MNASSKTLPLFAVQNMYYDLNTYYTNIPPTGAYQGYGAPKGYFAIMSCMDELAHKLGVDSLAICWTSSRAWAKAGRALSCLSVRVV